MKLSALAAQIKGCGHCEVINNGGRIFVGTGSAFYCMDGYPRTQDAGELGAMLGIRHALAWHDKPEGDRMNVCFDKPLNRSDQPQPTVKLTTTADHEPKCDGKKAEGGRTKK